MFAATTLDPQAGAPVPEIGTVSSPQVPSVSAGPELFLVRH